MEMLDAPRSKADLDLLLQEVAASPYIGQLTPQEIETHVKDRTIRFFYDNGELVGFGAWDNIGEDWREIGPFYALNKQRGKGLGTRIVESLVNLNSTKRLYMVTKNPIVKKLAVRLGFHKVGAGELSWPIYRHLISRLTLSRFIQLVRKLSLDPVSQYIRTT